MAELTEIGLKAELETFSGCDSLGQRLLLHVAGTVLALGALWFAPILTLLLGSAALASMIYENSTRGVLLSWHLVRRSSQNVVAQIPATGAPQRRVVVLGHYDTQRTGWLWKEGLVSRLAPLLAKAPGALKSPLFLVMVAMILTPILGLAALLSASTGVLTVAAAICLAITLIATVILAQWGWGPFVPGASDNATGAAAVLSVAEAWLADPIEGVELAILAAGCEETGLVGAAAYAERHRQAHAQLPTRFVNIDSLGYGRPRFLAKERSLAGVPYSYPSDLVSAVASVADSRGMVDPGPHVLPLASDAIAFLSRGVPGISILAWNDGGHMPNYHQLTDTTERMDFDVAWEGVTFAEAVTRSLAEPDGTTQ